MLANEMMDRMAGLRVAKEGDKNVSATNVDQTANGAGTNAKTKGKTRSLVSRFVGVSEGYIQKARALKKEAPDLYEKVRVGKFNLRKAEGHLYKRREAAAKDTSAVVFDPAEKRFLLHNCDILEAPIQDGSIDAIITDPPYGGDDLDCWRKLGEFGARKLKAGGVLLAMGGLYNLPEQIQNLKAGGLEYYWMLCCMYERQHGDYPRPRKVRTFWKPVLWFVKGEYDRTFQETDVFPDPYANASRGKKYHRWGQSLPFFTTLINKFTYADELVCDPFLGGGTTGIACLALKRRFVGIEVDPVAYATSHRRLTEWKPEPITVELTPQAEQEALAS
ncbi:MAG TPA: DNA methyltransferase [Verrucomicrobiota bacterium]|nr:DNA methyltransferase [Verrucomicrobiota bacterium]